MEAPFYISVLDDVLEPPYLMGNVFVREKNYFLAEHTHPFYHVNFVTEGEAVIHTCGKRYRVTAPGYMILPPAVPHAIESADGYAQVGMNLAAEGDGRVSLLTAFCGGGVKVGSAARLSVSFPHFFEMVSSGADPLSVWRLRSAYDRLLLSLVEEAVPPSPFVLRLNALAKERDLTKMSLLALCETLHFSKTHVERLFRKEMGISAVAYLSRLRIARAAALLSDGDLPLAAIAEECGFFDASHFGKCFKRAMGLAPGDYRRQNRRQVRDESPH